MKLSEKLFKYIQSENILFMCIDIFQKYMVFIFMYEYIINLKIIY